MAEVTLSTPGDANSGRLIPDSPKATGAPPASWRIDDLARRADVTVDTIRFYQRERLLPPPDRQGRHKVYGPDHLRRLATIKALQQRRFSLAAIRAFLDGEQAGLAEGVFRGGDDAAYDVTTLIGRSGLDPELIDRLRAVGLLRDPAEFGREAYDSRDLDVLRALGALGRLGIPADLTVQLARIYVAGVEAMQREVLELFRSGGFTPQSAEELAAFQARAADAAGDLLPHVQRVVDYVHQKTLERLTLRALEAARDEAAEAAPDVAAE